MTLVNVEMHHMPRISPSMSSAYRHMHGWTKCSGITETLNLPRCCHKCEHTAGSRKSSEKSAWSGALNWPPRCQGWSGWCDSLGILSDSLRTPVKRRPPSLLPLLVMGGGSLPLSPPALHKPRMSEKDRFCKALPVGMYRWGTCDHPSLPLLSC